MKDVITTLIPRYGELNRIYKDWFDNKGFSFEKQKFITKFYLDYNDVTVLETAILELVFHLPQEQYTLILNSLKKEVCENISYYKKGCMPDEQTVYNICFRVSEIYKEAIEEQQYKTTKLHAPLNEAYHRYDSTICKNRPERKPCNMQKAVSMKSIGWAATSKRHWRNMYLMKQTSRKSQPNKNQMPPTYRKKCWERNRLSISIWNCFRSFM